jgi:hypothetical protein
MKKAKNPNPLSNLLYALFFIAILALQARGGEVREIIVVYKTHFDIGYTDLVTNVLNRYRTRFVDGAMQAIEHSRSLPQGQQFVWTIPGWPLKQMLWPGQTPDRREKILKALREGRLTVHAMPFSLQTESLDLEDLVRGLVFSTEVARENGLPLPRAAKMTDVPQHTWVLPTLLKHAGIDFLQIGCNGGSAPMRVPLLFWWEGPDGSRLLTSYSPDYGTPLVPPKDWPYHTWLAMIMTGDNHGPPTTEEVDKLLQQAAKELPNVKIRFGRLEDFYDAIVAEKNQNIPVVRGDMPDTWIHGFESFPVETKLAWDVRPLEGALAMLDTELRAAGMAPSPLAGSLARAYENSLLYSEHTFGFYGSQPGGFWYGEAWKQKLAAGAYDLFLKSFEDKSAYIRTTVNIVTNALEERMQLLAQNVDTEGPRIVVFNPLPWKRSGEVSIQMPEGGWRAVRDLATGRIVTPVMTESRTMCFAADDVPPGGYKTFQPVPGLTGALTEANVSNGESVIENRFFRLKVDAARGGLVSLVDLRAGRELVAKDDEDSFGSYCHERFASTNVNGFLKSYARGKGGWVDNDFGKPGMPGPDNLPYAALRLTNWTVSAQTSPLKKTILLCSADAAPLAKAVTLRFTLYESQPYLGVEWAVKDKKPSPIPEGGWLCLPFAIAQPRFQLARLGSLIDPAKDIVDGGNRHLLCLNSGMTITGSDGYGVGLCPMDSPLVSLDETGLWKFSWRYTPQRARVFVNLYNNQWNTNFRLWQEGSWDSRVRIWTIHGADAQQNLIKPAWEARAPLVAVYANREKGKLPWSKIGLSLSRPGVLVTHFGPDPYSDRTLLRVWEQAGDSGSLTVKLPAELRATRAWPVNLRGERAGAAMKITSHSLTFRLAAFAPASFRLE